MPSVKSMMLAVAALCTALLPAQAGLFGPKEPHQEARTRAEAALKRGDYTTATNEIQSALNLAPAGEVQSDLDVHFRKLLQDYAWREHKQASQDDAFFLITRAWEDAPEKLQKSFARSRDAILQAYAQHHMEIAQEELNARGLATAIAEFTLAAMADNDLGREAADEAARIQKLRRELELELSVAGKKIEGEEWPDAEQRIRHVQDADTSLVTQTAELATLLATRHCAAALRDGRAALEKKDFIAAHRKATEARSLNTGSTEPDTLLGTIRNGYTKLTAADVARAIAEDRRNDIKAYADTMASFSMDEEADRLRNILMKRGRADDALTRADSSLRRGSPGAAVEHLTEATDLWPEHTEARKRLTATSTAMALADREDLLVRTRPLDQDDAFTFWQRTPNDLSGWNMRERDRISRLLALTQEQIASNALNRNYPLVTMVYGMKARHVYPGTDPVQKRFSALISQAASRIAFDRLRMVFGVEVTTATDADGSVSISELEADTLKALSSPSRWVTVGRQSEVVQSKADAKFKILVAVEKLNVKTETSQSTKSIRYVSSVAYDPNPRYTQLVSMQASAQAQVSACESALASARSQSLNANVNTFSVSQNKNPQQLLAASANSFGSSMAVSSAQNSLNRARNQLSSINSDLRNTPETVKREIWSDHSYTVTRYTRSAQVRALVRLVDAGNRVLDEEVVSDSYSESDDTNEGFPAAKLEADPLTLPSEDDIREKFVSLVLTGAPNAAERLFDSFWEDRMSQVRSVQETWERWEKGLSLVLQRPSLASIMDDDIRSQIRNLPPSISDQIIRTAQGE